MAPIRVLIADDHQVLRAGLRQILEREPDLAVVGEAGDAAAAVSRAAECLPDLVLLDLGMPGGGGLTALRALRERWPALRVLVLTQYDDHAHLRLALDGGAAGYVTKSSPADELLTAIRSVHRGRSFMSPCVDDGRVTFPGTAAVASPAVLAPREREVLELVARGHTAREIAQRLGLSPKTVENYRTKAMEKLGLESRAELVAYALAAGLLAPGPGDDAP